MLDSNLLSDHALRYRARGWSVIPIEEKGKKPMISWKEYQKRKATKEEIVNWWQTWPNANIGIVTGEISGLVVVDLDGLDGIEYVKQRGWPACPTVNTGKGLHLYFAYPGGVGNAVSFNNIKGLDIRGDGGYVVAPPSIHPTGAMYVWVEKPSEQLPELPTYFIISQTQTNNKKKIDDLLQGVPEGERNVSAARLVGHWFATGLEPDEVLKRLIEWNSKNDPSLPSSELLRVYESIKSRERNKKEGQEQEQEKEHETDLGNAERLVLLHGRDLRYCRVWGDWLIWDGKRWKRDLDDEVGRRAIDVVKKIYILAGKTDDEFMRRRLVRHALRSEALNRLDAMVGVARKLLPATPDMFDKKPMLLNCLNGTLDLKTGELYPHKREDMLTQMIPVNYNPSATCPLWEAFLDRILAGNKNLIEFLQKAVGYTLTGVVTAHVIFFLYGTGANGKGVFLHTILNLLGDYGKPIAPELLLADKGDHPTIRADLLGARMAVAMETDEGKSFKEALLKWITGKDKLQARFMRQDSIVFEPTHKVWLATNHKPTIKGTDWGIWRRIRLIPFEVTIPLEEQDDQLEEKLQEEFEGILAWAVRGCLEWQRTKLGMPPEVEEATTSYRSEMDVMAQFIEDECIVDPEAGARAGDLFKAYTQWCSENGEHASSQRSFGMRLREKKFKPERRGNGERWWKGIGLKNM